MDLLYQRYASPFSFMSGMIQTGRFSEFVDNFLEAYKEDREEQHYWEFYLHKVFEGSYQEFKDEIETDRANQTMSRAEFETTVQHTMNILNNFSPKEEGGEN